VSVCESSTCQCYGCQVDMHKKFWWHKFGFTAKIAFQPQISTIRRLAIISVYKLDVILTKVLLDLIHCTTSDSILTRKIGFQKKKKISFPKISFLILHLRKLHTLIFLKCVGKAWGLKTTLPQTPHSAGSLRHWVRPLLIFLKCVHAMWGAHMSLTVAKKVLCKIAISGKKLFSVRNICTWLCFLHWSGVSWHMCTQTFSTLTNRDYGI